MIRSKILFGVCTAGLAVMTQALPFLTIDNFDDPAGGQSAAIFNGTPGATASSIAFGLAALGGSRSINVEIEATILGGSSSSVEANAFTSPNNFQFTTSSKVDSKGWIVWDANGTGLNVDFAAGSAFVLSGLDDDLATTYAIKVETFGGGSSEAAVTTAGNDAGLDLVLPFGSFSAGANWLDIDRITLLVNPPRGGDVSIDSLTVQRAVPDPLATGTALLAASALLILARGLRAVRAETEDDRT